MEFPWHSRIFIGNFDSRNVSEKEVEQVFSKYGSIVDKIMIHKGFTFVQYSSESEATAAIANENGRIMGNKKIEIQYAKSTLRRNHKRRRDEPYYPNKRSKNYHNSSSSDYQQKIKVPIFIFNNNLGQYGQVVNNQFFSHNIHTDIFYVGDDFLKILPNEKYLIYLFPRNSTTNTIYFCSFRNDGTTPGFMDTPIRDVIDYIKDDIERNRKVPKTYSQPYNNQSILQQPKQQNPSYHPSSTNTGFIQPNIQGLYGNNTQLHQNIQPNIPTLQNQIPNNQYQPNINVSQPGLSMGVNQQVLGLNKPLAMNQTQGLNMPTQMKKNDLSSLLNQLQNQIRKK